MTDQPRVDPKNIEALSRRDQRLVRKGLGLLEESTKWDGEHGEASKRCNKLKYKILDGQLFLQEEVENV